MDIKQLFLQTYPRTSHAHNNHNTMTFFEGIEHAFRTDGFNIIYEIISKFPDSCPVKVRYIHSDGGMREYQIHYNIDRFTILIADWSSQRIWTGADHYPGFENFNDFCVWLQNKVDDMPKTTLIIK